MSEPFTKGDWVTKTITHMNVAEIRNLTVNYGAFTAISDLNLSIPEGCIGLLGPNGAGKTTLLKTLLGFVKPASGEAHILGSKLGSQDREIRQRIGLMPEQDCHIPGMSAVRFVAYAGELAGMPASQALRRAHEVLEYSGLGEARYRNVETFSTGMKQRIKLAQALVHGPKLILLDEPTNGLDPRGREEMLQLVRDISAHKDVNVLVSSHLLPDIERTCDEVIVMFGGQVRRQGKIKDLLSIEGHPIDIEVKAPVESFPRQLQNAGFSVVGLTWPMLRVTARGTINELSPAIFKSAKETGTQIRGLSLAQRTLEEVFMEAIG